MRSDRPAPLHCAVLSALVFALAGAPLAPDPLRAATPEATSAAAAAEVDPVVGEVLRLLDAGIGEPVILRWLAEENRPPGRPSAEELLALKKAGASDALITALLERARRGGPAPTPTPVPPSPPASSSSPTAALVPEPAAASTLPAAASPPPTAPAPAVTLPDPKAPVALSLSTLYIHWPEEGEPRDLVVYLDGRPFDPVPAARSARSAGARGAHREVAPGRHVLRWAQERHVEQPGERGRHAARFDPEPLLFELTPGTPAAIEFEFRDPSGLPFATPKGPITVRVRQGDREIATRLEGGDDPFRWPGLCEEIEVNLADRKPSLQERLLLKSCSRWADLWSQVPGDVPTRDEVRPAPAAAP